MYFTLNLFLCSNYFVTVADEESKMHFQAQLNASKDSHLQQSFAQNFAALTRFSNTNSSNLLMMPYRLHPNFS